MAAERERADEERRVEELLRVNAELAAEIRALALGRTDAPRSSRLPSTRRVARLTADFEEARAQLEAARSELAHLEAHNRELRDLVEDQAAQITHLQAGFSGLLRRLRQRLSRR